MKLAKLSVVSSLAIATCLSAPAFAQDNTDESEGRSTTNTIVVTAEFREANLQDTPIAITAVNAEMLDARGQTSIEQVANQAPNVSLRPQPQNGGSGLIAFIRGVGQVDFNYALDPGVGIYVDDVYIPTLSSSLLELMDLDRIEVLRGPQGTLYGRNTTGGAVNIISSRPTGELGGDFTLSYGSRNSVRALANIDLPAMGAFAIKGTLLYTDRDGYVENAGAAHDYHEAGQLAGRVAVRWTPSPDFTADFAFDRGRVTSTMPYYVNPDFVGLGGPFAGYSADIDNTYTTLDIDASRSHFTDYQLTLNWDVADALTIRSLSSYRRTNSNQDINYGLAQSYPFVNPPYPFNGDLFVTQQHQYKGEQ